MTHTLIIETQDEKDFALIKGLADRLGLPVKEQHSKVVFKLAQEDAIRQLFGSWQGDESGVELTALIRSARNDQPRDIGIKLENWIDS